MKMGRTPCCSKNSDLNRGAWTAQEDLILSQYIKTHGDGRWRSIPQNTGLKRCGKSCRLRWLNYLRPDIKRGNISPDEEDLILKLHGLLGNRWSLIAGRLPSRTDNEIKNYWNTHLSRKINSLPPKKTLPKHASPDPCGRGFQSSPVKVTAVRINKGRSRHNSSSGIFNHQENGVPQAIQICNSIMKEDNSESIDIPMDNNNDKSQSLSMKIDGQIQIQHSELFSSEFDACTRTDMTQLLDHNIHANSYTGNDEEENREGDWVEEPQHQQKSCLQWLSLLLESEEDWEERNMLLESEEDWEERIMHDL